MAETTAVNIVGPTGDLRDANFPVDEEGRVYHLGLKFGELANKVPCVGDPQRAERLKKYFDTPDKIFTRVSNRGFITYTGTFNQEPITIMSIGMGPAMIDFMIREGRHIVHGPLSIVRLGTCGTPKQDIPVGTILVANSSVSVITNYDAYHSDGTNENSLPFIISKPIKPDQKLTQALKKCLEESVVNHKVMEAMDVTCDSFYSSQGRLDPSFNDRNSNLVDTLLEKYPDVGSLQMETFHMLHLARLSTVNIETAACVIVLAQRRSNEFLDMESKHQLEEMSGIACLRALQSSPNGLASFKSNPACVWNKM